jgi:hypothetical protein
MSPPDDTHLDVGDDQDDHDDEDQDYKLYWDLRYSFRVDDPYTAFQMTAAWLDGDGMLCYRHGDTLYKHHPPRRSVSVSPDPVADCPPCDQRLQLPATTPSPFKCDQDTMLKYRTGVHYMPIRRRWDHMSWDIYGGYRPTLLSPLSLSLPPRLQDADDEAHSRHKLEQDVLSVVRYCDATNKSQVRPPVADSVHLLKD